MAALGCTMTTTQILFRALVFAALAEGAVACKRPPPAPPPPAPRFAIHEWGLVAVDANAPALARLATEVGGGVHLAEAPHGTRVLGQAIRYGYGGKPVIYVHLEPGVSEATFDLRLGIPAANLVERWPGDAELASGNASGWQHVLVRRGPCASPTPPPTASSVECTRTRDGFCEAAEIPRYYGARASCLHVGSTESELLFYRAEGIPTDALPIRMVSENGAWRPSRSRAGEVTGPIFFITAKDAGREVSIHLLEPDAIDRGLLDSGAGSRLVDPTTAKDLIRLEAVQRGLTESEADAFADAWAPAVFARCHRDGPEASGTLPAAFEQSTTSLVYFAPSDVVDRMIPLSTTPRPSRANRAFLVRYVDGSSTIHREDARRISEQLAAEANAASLNALQSPLRAVVRPAGSAEVHGGLTPDPIRRVIQRNISQVHQCYVQALARDPSLAGRMTVSFIIAPTGSVGTARADDDMGDPAFDSCVSDAIRRWTFPQPDPAGPVVVRFPFAFSVSGGP